MTEFFDRGGVVSHASYVHNALIDVKSKCTHDLAQFAQMEFDDRPEAAKRLQLAREAKGIDNPRQAAARFGWVYDTYIQHENGTRGISRSAGKYAKAYGVPEGWLLTGEGNPGLDRASNRHPPTDSAQEVRISSVLTRRAAVDGKVEAGSWRMVDDFDQSERRFIDVPSDEEFPNARIRVYEVAGDSMDAYERAPIRPGSLAVCLDYEDVMHRMPKRDGMVVVVERSADGGQFRERSIKEIEIHDDRIEFHPRSNNPEHKPIVVPIDYEADDGVRVQIVAVLRRIITETIRF